MLLRFRLSIVFLLLLRAFSAGADNPAVTVNVNAVADVHAINPMIYGLNFADTATLNALNCTNNRYGGNRTSRYNWSQNVDQTGEFYLLGKLSGLQTSLRPRGHSCQQHAKPRTRSRSSPSR